MLIYIKFTNLIKVQNRTISERYSLCIFYIGLLYEEEHNQHKELMYKTYISLSISSICTFFFGSMYIHTQLTQCHINIIYVHLKSEIPFNLKAKDSLHTTQIFSFIFSTFFKKVRC